MLAHTVHDVQRFKRHINSNRLNGGEKAWLTPQQAKEYCPPLNSAAGSRYPVMGAALQRRGGVARHAAVAWGCAHAAAARAVDLVKHFAATVIRPVASGRVFCVDSPEGFILVQKVMVSALGNPAGRRAMPGMRTQRRNLSAPYR